MRTTVTLEDDVWTKLRNEVRKSGRSFKDVVNEYLRLGLDARKSKPISRKFKIRAEEYGLRIGVGYESASELLERLEGLNHR
ncbi:MAG: hypothetical protein WD696_21375 [Bryobacteraceae bacterium]